MGTPSRKGHFHYIPKLLNRTKKKYDWDNGEFDDPDEVVLVEEVPHPSITSDVSGVHLGDSILIPSIVDVEESEQQMALENSNNVNITDITGLFPHITGVYSTT